MVNTQLRNPVVMSEQSNTTQILMEDFLPTSIIRAETITPEELMVAMIMDMDIDLSD